jgi:DNA-binding transcriptional regulator YdaS (Cro superfamily)
MSRIGIDALARCVTILGSQGAVAKTVGAIQQTVSACLNNGRRVPAEWVLALETATAAAGEKVSRHDLRPDLYPPVESPRALSGAKRRKAA